MKQKSNNGRDTSFQIGIIRHPPVDVPEGFCYGRTDVALKEGWERFAVLPEQFRDIKIYTSPASRCLKLAQKIAETHELSYQIDERLLEFDFGQWEAKLWEDIPQSLIDTWAKDPWSWSVPDGENGQKLFDRALEVWNELKQKQENALIVSHGGPLRLLRQVAENKETIELLGPLPDFGKLEIFYF